MNDQDPPAPHRDPPPATDDVAGNADVPGGDSPAPGVDMSLLRWMLSLSYDQRLATLRSFAATFGPARLRD